MAASGLRPPGAVRQLDAVTALLRTTLDDALAGCLLHGSLAMNGFDPESSDIDLLVVLDRPLTILERDALALGLLELSGAPHPIELSAVTVATLADWRHPCAHDFHFGEEHRGRFERAAYTPATPVDPDLAMHVTVARARGVDLLGTWPPAWLPRVPEADFIDAARTDFAWAAREPGGALAYRHANACRTLAWLETRLVLSKTEGIAWCRERGIAPADALARIEAWLA